MRVLRKAFVKEGTRENNIQRLQITLNEESSDIKDDITDKEKLYDDEDIGVDLFLTLIQECEKSFIALLKISPLNAFLNL